MPYIASGVDDGVDPDMNTVVGDGQCVAYVKEAAGAPATASWGEGENARKSTSIAKGTAIATFQGGVYGNFTDGRSHAAIFIMKVDDGLVVHDQWAGQPVHQRTIRYKGGAGAARNDGDAYSIIEPATLVDYALYGLRRLRLLFTH